MRNSFDTAIGRAATPRPGAQPGRIRRWLAITAILIVTGHVIMADPIGRLKADLRAASNCTDTGMFKDGE